MLLADDQEGMDPTAPSTVRPDQLLFFFGIKDGFQVALANTALNDC
jgi:hypothetical protein